MHIRSEASRPETDTAVGLDIVSAMEFWARCRPELEVLGFLDEGEDAPRVVTYAALHRRAAALAGRLRRSASTGDRVVVLHEPGIAYVVAMLGCLYAGLVAVPAYPPRPRRGLDRIRRLIRDAGCRLAIIGADVAGRMPLTQLLPDGLEMLVTSEEEQPASGAGDIEPPSPGRIAYLQYTSGSTSEPRGVMVSHANLMHNVAMIRERFRIGAGSRGLIWLPPYHDMGLIGGIMTPLMCGFPCLLMSPATVVRSPFRWLQWIGRFGCTISGGPDFAFRHAAHAITEEQKADLDLSTWNVAFCGAEPIRPATLDAFATAFGPCGFQSDAFHPCYGLAEATLMVTGTPSIRSPLVTDFDEDHLATGSAVRVSSGKRLVSCGVPADGTVVKIVDADGREAPNRRIGEIWVAGPSVAEGYWMDPSATRSTFGVRPEGSDADGPFLRTGDLGFLDDGELYVTGRIKELLILRGRKIHPQDIEEVVTEALPAFRHLVAAAFGVDRQGGSGVAVAIELGREGNLQNASDMARLATTIRHAVGSRLDVAIGPVVFLGPGGVPRTSSGKLQRYRCAEHFEAGTLDARFVDDQACADLAMVLRAQGQPAAAIDRNECGVMVDRLLAEAGLRGHAGQLAPDSLQVVRLAALIERDFGVKLTAGQLFGIESRDDVVALVSDRAQGDALLDVEPVGDSDGTATEQLSAGQRALWFIDTFGHDAAAYNAPFAVRINGRIDIDTVRAAIDTLPRLHAALRVKYHAGADEPTQSESPAEPVPWECIDAAGWTGEKLDTALSAVASVPFRLVDDPPLRAHLFRRSDTDQVLLLNTHHIRIDFWSFQIMLRDILTAIYPEHGRTATSRPGHYFRFVRWQRAYLKSPQADVDRRYWRKILEDGPVLSIPLDRPHATTHRLEGGLVEVPVDPRLSERLEAFACSQGVTVGMVLLGAYGLLLGMLSGQDDLVVGMPFSGRTRDEFAGTVGYFVNPLPMRLRIEAGDTTASYLRRIRDRMLEALEHQDYPSALMVQQLDMARSAAGNTLFQTMLVLNRPEGLEREHLIEHGPEGVRHVSPSGVEWTEHVLPQRYAKFDLVLAARDACGGLQLGLQYNASVFNRETIDGYATALATIIESMIAGGDIPLAHIHALPAGQRRQVNAWGHGPVRDYDLSAPMHRTIERRAAESPESIAVICGERKLSYGDLNTWANGLACLLSRVGAVPGRFVGVLVDRSIELPVATLAVMKSGAAFVPLDVDWPLDRLQKVVQRCDCVAVVTTGETADLAHRIGPRVTLVEEVSRESVADPVVPVGPEDPIYAFSTSGSTGEPKVAVIPHRGIANRFAWMDEFFGPAAAHRVLATTRQTYDSSVWQLFWPLVNGGATVIPSVETMLMAEHLTAMIAAHQVTMTDFVPSVFNALVPQLDADVEAARDLSSLRVVILGGEEITPATTRAFMARFTGIRVVNLYGPTEASIGCIACEVQPGETGRIPIGRPIANVNISIVDRIGRPVPVGTVGEIWIGGAAVGTGYAGDPEATARAFVRDSSTDGLAYKTGDLARWLPDGSIDFRGRLDDQVKIRGHRIELSEIEGVLRQHPDVKDAVVNVARGHSERPSLVAYVAYRATSGAAFGETAVLKWLRDHLPPWMVPTQIVALDVFPRTSSGKVDRRRLPSPPQARRPHRSPETSLERRLANLWCRVLRTDVAGLDDDFFESGGDSLLAVQLMSLVQKECGVSLPLRQLFLEPTLGNLATLASAASGTVPVSIPRASSDDDRMDIELLEKIDTMTDAEVIALTDRLISGRMQHDNA